MFLVHRSLVCRRRWCLHHVSSLGAPVAEMGRFPPVLAVYPTDCVGAVSAAASAIRALAISCTRLRSTLA